MRSEIIYVLENMDNEATMSAFVKRMTNEQLIQLQGMLSYTKNETRQRWNKTISTSITLK